MQARIVALGLAIGACVPAAKPHVAWLDAPLEVRDESDRDQAIDWMWAASTPGDRNAARTVIANAIASRIGEALEDDQPVLAAALLTQLASLWQRDPAAAGHDLAPHAALLHQLRARFGKSAALTPSVLAIALLAEVEPDQRAAHLAELDEVLAFADDLAIADNGQVAVRAQPIEVIGPAALTIPLPWLVDRYVGLLQDRQLAVSSLIEKSGASMQVVRAHHEILSTARRIAIALARAGRPTEIHAHLTNLRGIGTDRELAIRAEILADQPTANAYEELASALRTDEHTADLAAALATCRAGLARFPGDAELLATAADDAHALGLTDEAIPLYEMAFHAASPVGGPDRALRLGKAYADRISRFGFGGRPTAAIAAWHAAERYTADAARAHADPVWAQVAAIAQAALGRGLMSQGLVEDAQQALEASIARAPSVEAFESLTTLAVQTGHFADARAWDDRGRALLGTATAGDRYHLGKLERLAGDVERRAAQPSKASPFYIASLTQWASLGEDKDLPRGIAAERGLESGQATWWLASTPERPLQAVDAVLRAVEANPTATIAAGAVAFLLEIGRYRDALDAFHQGLGSIEVDELYKVYMALWVIGDARRHGEPPDRLAHDYLASRHGNLWYEQLAEAATGRLELAALRVAATTAPRRAELAFYSATLGLDPASATAAGSRMLLEQMVAAHLVLDAEYDLARNYLEQASPR